MRRTALFLAVRLSLAAALVLVLAATAAAPAAAQVAGLYYKEVEKEGRIYVFNTPERFASWSASGDMGTSLTLLGRGPNGETVVAENETAADLYFFKHNLDGYDRPTPKPASPEFGITYKDNKTTWETKNAKISLVNRFQGRYTLTDPEVGDSVGSFRIRRFHTIFEGTVYKDWKGLIQVNWTGATVVNDVTQSGTTVTRTRTQGPVLDDAIIQWAKHPLATVWVGQGKVFFGRQELTSDTKQSFVDRTAVSERFAAKRDQGIALTGLSKDKQFEYEIGIYNGNGVNQPTNDNKEYATGGRVVWAPLGEYKLEDSSFDYPSTARLAIGGGFFKNTLGTGNSEADLSRYGAELGFRIQGFSLISEYFTENRDPRVGAELDTDGYYAQAAYLLPNKKIEFAGRYGVISPDVATNQDQKETGVAASFYWDKHTHKLQGDYRILKDERTGVEDKEIRLQLQLLF